MEESTKRIYHGSKRVYSDDELIKMGRANVCERLDYAKKVLEQKRELIESLKVKLEDTTLERQTITNHKNSLRNAQESVKHYLTQIPRYEEILRILEMRSKAIKEAGKPSIVNEDVKYIRDYKMWEKYIKHLDKVVLHSIAVPEFLPKTARPDDMFIIRFSPFQANKAMYDNFKIKLKVQAKSDEILAEIGEATKIGDYQKRQELVIELSRLNKRAVEIYKENERIMKSMPMRELDPVMMIEELYRMSRHMMFNYNPYFGLVEQIRYDDGNIYLVVKKRQHLHEAEIDKQLYSACLSCFLNSEYAMVSLDNEYIPAGYLLHDRNDGKGMHYKFIDRDVMHTPTFTSVLAKAKKELETGVLGKKGFHEWWKPVDIENIEKYNSFERIEWRD